MKNIYLHIFSLYCIISVHINRKRIEKQNIFIKTILHYIKKKDIIDNEKNCLYVIVNFVIKLYM